jgi:hypothetical protein
MKTWNTNEIPQRFPTNSVNAAQITTLAARTKTDLIEYLKREGRRSRNLSRLKKLGYAAMLSIFAITTLVWLFSGLSTHHWSKFPWKALTFLNIFNFIGFLAAASQGQKSAAKTLAEVDDIQCVGVLAEAMEYTDKHGKVDIETRTVAESALIRLLPRVQATDRELFSLEQRLCLNKALLRDNKPLTLAILSAYEQVGDESCIGPVEKILAGKSALNGDEALNRAATHCLVALKENVETQRLSRTLVRPFMGSTDETLLRPVEGSSQTDTSLLLRPSAHQD